MTTGWLGPSPSGSNRPAPLANRSPQHRVSQVLSSWSISSTASMPSRRPPVIGSDGSLGSKGDSTPCWPLGRGKRNRGTSAAPLPTLSSISTRVGRGGSSTPCCIYKGATVSGAGQPPTRHGSVYFLSRLSPRLQWQQEAVKAALHRLTDSLIPYYQERAECRESNIHQFASLGSEMSKLG